MCCSDLPVCFFLLSRHDFISIVWHFGTADCEREKKELLGIKIGDFFISGSLETLFAGKIDWTQNWRRDKRRFVTSVFVMAISNNSTTSGSAGIYGWSELWVWARKKTLKFLTKFRCIYGLILFFSVVNVMLGQLQVISPNPVSIISTQIYRAMFRCPFHIRISWNDSSNAFQSILKRNLHDDEPHNRKPMAQQIVLKKNRIVLNQLMYPNRVNHSFDDSHSRDLKKERWVFDQNNSKGSIQ